MTSIDEHKRKIKEHLEEIDEAIDKGIENKPITLGFHCSACSLEYLEIYLHIIKKSLCISWTFGCSRLYFCINNLDINKLEIGKIIKHDWFKRPKKEQKKEPLIERKLPVQFEKKQEIYDLIYSIEKERNSLMYGKPKEGQVKKVLDLFLKLKEIFRSLFENEGFEI